jgi:hypothetical protein
MKSMKERFASVTGVFTALIAASCCIGPALFLAFGITGLGFLSRLEVFRPYLLIATFVLAGISYYYAYGKGSRCKDGEVCNPRAMRINRVLFWVLVGFAVFGISFPYVAAWLLL